MSHQGAKDLVKITIYIKILLTKPNIYSSIVI